MCCRAADCYHRSVILEDFPAWFVAIVARSRSQQPEDALVRALVCGVRVPGSALYSTLHRRRMVSDRRKCSASPLGASLGASPHCRFEDCHPLTVRSLILALGATHTLA